MAIAATPAGSVRARRDLFGGCGPRDLAAIDRLSTERAVAPGHVLLRQGEPADQFLVITAGRAPSTPASRISGRSGPARSSARSP